MIRPKSGCLCKRPLAVSVHTGFSCAHITGRPTKFASPLGAWWTLWFQLAQCSGVCNLSVLFLKSPLLHKRKEFNMGVEEEQVRLLDDPEEVLRTKWNSKLRPFWALCITLLSLLFNVVLIASLLITLKQDHKCHDPSLRLVFCEYLCSLLHLFLKIADTANSSEAPAESNVEYVVTRPQGAHDPTNLYRNTLPDGSPNVNVDEYWNDIYKREKPL